MCVPSIFYTHYRFFIRSHVSDSLWKLQLLLNKHVWPFLGKSSSSLQVFGFLQKCMNV